MNMWVVVLMPWWGFQQDWWAKRKSGDGVKNSFWRLQRPRIALVLQLTLIGWPLVSYWCYKAIYKQHSK
jgi:hypothetical protein